MVLTVAVKLSVRPGKVRVCDVVLSALASGIDGLQAIREIVAGAADHLHRGGWLLFEHGWNQGEAARTLLTEAGYAEVFTAQDLERRDRVSGGRW